MLKGYIFIVVNYVKERANDMRIYVAGNSFCCSGKVSEVMKMLAALPEDRITLRQYLRSLLH